MVPSQSVPEGCTRASLERVAELSASSGAEQLHAAVGDMANIEAVVGDDELPRRIDPRQRARHHAERMNFHAAAGDVGFEQASFDDVEPPGGAGPDIIGRPLAEMAALGREHRRRNLLRCARSGVIADHTVEKR